MIYNINELKNKNNRIISIDTEKTFNKIQHPFMIKKKKNSPESRHRRSIPQHNKGDIQKTHNKYYLSWRKAERNSFKIRNNTRVPTLITNIQNSFGGLGTTIREEKKIKAIQIGKEVKLSLFADDMILYIENSKDSTRKLLILSNEYSKVTGYKISTQKSLVLLYTNDENF